MFKRLITSTLTQNAQQFPATLLTGPRQSGKTTLLKSLFPQYGYANLESPDTLLRLQGDPRGFLFANKQGWIIDEAQQFPQLFSYLQECLDEPHRQYPFILSGSQNFLLNEQISQTLAGRVAVLELLPLSYAEYLTNPDVKPLPLWQFLYQGSYPRPYQEHLDVTIWYNSYIRTYLERDVRTLINVRDLTKFQLFLKLCAGRHGQLLNLSSLAQDCGISQTTATEWLSVLENSYIIYRLSPHYKNFNKRLVKTNKLYFYDTAIVSHLLGIESPDHLQIHAQRGFIFEGFVLTEIIKFYLAQGKKAPIYFWRDQTGTEIDVILEKGEELIAIELKSTATFTVDLLTEIRRWRKIAGNGVKKAIIIYGGTESFEYDGFSIVSWDKCAEFLTHI